MFKKLTLLFICLLFATTAFGQDPNFHIYLCFGQSNMEGQGKIEGQDKVVDERFQVLQSVDCSNIGRTKGEWYTAVPPLSRCYNGLSPADYFGRTMVDYLADDIRVGVINVAVGGCPIELFDKDIYQDYVAFYDETWYKNIVAEYGGNPYQHLIDLAKLAQQDGVIKGVLLHQGESNTGDPEWPDKVKTVYDNMLADLGLEADSIPILAGEVVSAEQNGCCSSMNTIINKLPETIPNSYVISSYGCSDKEDNTHFNSAGYRLLGVRYAVQMLELMGIEADPADPTDPVGTEATFYEAECGQVGSDWDITNDGDASNQTFIVVKEGLESESDPVTDAAGQLVLPFTTKDRGEFKVYVRVNCPLNSEDSFWISVDGSEFKRINGLRSEGWEWDDLGKFYLAPGEHELVITYREKGAKLDKICISNYTDAPEGLGEDAINVCDSAVKSDIPKVPQGFSLKQNYPNPFNPVTNINYTIPYQTKVTLNVMDVSGRIVEVLVDSEQPKGDHNISFNGKNCPSGVYFYQLKTIDGFEQTRKMVLVK